MVVGSTIGTDQRGYPVNAPGSAWWSRTYGGTSPRTMSSMADKVTLSLNSDTLARARAEAQREGVSLSAWIDRAARRAALRDAGRRYQEWLHANPDVKEEVDAWQAFAERNRPSWPVDPADAA